MFLKMPFMVLRKLFLSKFSEIFFNIMNECCFLYSVHVIFLLQSLDMMNYLD